MQHVIDCLAKNAVERIEDKLKRGWFVVSLTAYGRYNDCMIIVFEKEK